MKKQFISALVAGLSVIMVSGYQAVAAPVFNVTNGHYYEVVNGMFDWTVANDMANGMSYLGMSGHLATITDVSENLFLTNTFNDGLFPNWLGGFQPQGSPEPNGNWTWVTGEPFVYQNWGGGEPNNMGMGDESRLHFWAGYTNDGAAWNDTNVSWLAGYVVEYQGTPVPGAPLPGAGLTLLGTTCITGLIANFRRRKKS